MSVSWPFTSCSAHALYRPGVMRAMESRLLTNAPARWPSVSAFRSVRQRFARWRSPLSRKPSSSWRTPWATNCSTRPGTTLTRVLLVEAHYVLGVTLFGVGKFAEARTHLEEALAHYDLSRSSIHIAIYTQDPAVICLARLAVVLWFLGAEELATQRANEGVRLAEQISHPSVSPTALPGPRCCTEVGITRWLVARRDTTGDNRDNVGAERIRAQEGLGGGHERVDGGVELNARRERRGGAEVGPRHASNSTTDYCRSR